jgi:putative membrane protein
MKRGRDGGGKRGPVILDLEETPLPDAPEPAEAPPVPEPGEHSAAAQALHMAARGPRWGLGAIFAGGIGALLLLALGVGLHDFLRDLLARMPVLGFAGLALAAAAGLALLAMLAGELLGLARLARIDGIRQAAESAATTPGTGPAKAVAGRLDRLYAGRMEMDAARARAGAAAGEMSDGASVIAAAERHLMPPADAAAEAAVVRGARNVAAFTALLPNPAVDLVVVLLANIRMIRQVAAVYGGRAGWLGSWRLLRAVATHLVASGAVSATDDLLGPALGGGILSKLSRRFGEAAINAALTARVGVAAMEVCRPLPFAQRPAPRASAIVMGALQRWRETAREDGTRRREGRTPPPDA